MKKIILAIAACVVGMSLFTSCARKVTRVATDAQIDISGRWNVKPL